MDQQELDEFEKRIKATRKKIEMQKIKAVFPACSMDYLFASDGIVGDCDNE